MIKTYCDNCGAERESALIDNGFQITGTLKNVKYSIVVKITDGHICRDLCKDCIVEILKQVE